MYFYLMEYKQNCTKIYVKEAIFCEKFFFIRPGSKENVIFRNIRQKPFFFAKKTILKIKVTVFRVQKTFFPF